MAAKEILKRYIDRNRSTLPKVTKELRQHLAGVAKQGKLKISAKQLDELAGIEKPETGQKSTNSKKTGDSTK